MSSGLTCCFHNEDYTLALALVQELVASLGIELLYLFAYSPNLNLIERFWKRVNE
jgi:transposase